MIMEKKTKSDIIKARICGTDTLRFDLARWRMQSHKLVFTNGCFDLLHPGHVEYLAKAAELGNKLIIGLNSDESVRRLNKGSGRPIQNEQARAIVLASLHLVDRVVIFHEDTPLELIKFIQPDVLVKGGDWKPEDIVGADVVKAYGGKVLSIPFVDGYSTTAIEQKIKNN